MVLLHAQMIRTPFAAGAVVDAFHVELSRLSHPSFDHLFENTNNGHRRTVGRKAGEWVLSDLLEFMAPL